MIDSTRLGRIIRPPLATAALIRRHETPEVEPLNPGACCARVSGSLEICILL